MFPYLGIRPAPHSIVQVQSIIHHINVRPELEFTTEQNLKLIVTIIMTIINMIFCEIIIIINDSHDPHGLVESRIKHYPVTPKSYMNTHITGIEYL